MLDWCGTLAVGRVADYAVALIAGVLGRATEAVDMSVAGTVVDTAAVGVPAADTAPAAEVAGQAEDLAAGRAAVEVGFVGVGYLVA